jgi:cell division protein FtsL
MSEPLLADAYPATVPATIPGTGARRAVAKPAGTVKPTSAAKPAAAKPARGNAPRHAAAAKSSTGTAKQGAMAKGPKVQSSRAKARAQARAARPEGRSSAKGAAAVAAAAAKVDPLAPETPEQRHLEVVGQRSRLGVARQHRTRLWLGLAGAAAVIVAFGLVYLHVIAAQRQFTLDDLNTQVTQQEATYQRLRLQVAQLNSPARIVAEAETKLGMVQPSSVTYLTPSGSSASATPGASPSQAPAGDSDWPQVKALIAGTP